jgi:hypothetical protein
VRHRRAHLVEPQRFGGYQGIGLGGSYKWFSLYTRIRFEESIAQGVPMTLWPSVSLGTGYDLTRRFSLDVVGGYLGYFNARSDQSGWFYQAGLTVRFGR